MMVTTYGEKIYTLVQRSAHGLFLCWRRSANAFAANCSR